MFKGRFTGEADELNENWWVILVNIPHFSHETGETNELAYRNDRFAGVA